MQSARRFWNIITVLSLSSAMKGTRLVNRWFSNSRCAILACNIGLGKNFLFQTIGNLWCGIFLDSHQSRLVGAEKIIQSRFFLFFQCHNTWERRWELSRGRRIGSNGFHVCLEVNSNGKIHFLQEGCRQSDTVSSLASWYSFWQIEFLHQSFLGLVKGTAAELGSNQGLGGFLGHDSGWCHSSKCQGSMLNDKGSILGSYSNVHSRGNDTNVVFPASRLLEWFDVIKVLVQDWYLDTLDNLSSLNVDFTVTQKELWNWNLAS
mmetsp:Transcript_33872/g.82109  ORF Transcript_33872/g.82109 Transcript_33872/m.82109 type:complete len:262 (+) Transcript_33872:4060-4845(+)